jgi:hypothetical protein
MAVSAAAEKAVGNVRTDHSGLIGEVTSRGSSVAALTVEVVVVVVVEEEEEEEEARSESEGNRGSAPHHRSCVE